jgi:hypothetical protein
VVVIFLCKFIWLIHWIDGKVILLITFSYTRKRSILTRIKEFPFIFIEMVVLFLVK